MADVELIIKIPEGLKNDFESEQWTALSCMEMKDALEKATPLPKGHGRLVDEQNISDYVHSHIQEINTGYGDLNSHTNRILRMIESYIDNAPTIIEADKAESEDKE